MDTGDLRGVLTAVLLVLFIGIWAWSFSRKRGKDFREAERLPLDDDERPPSRNDDKGQGT
jgi:cytochrome c oxidase cbb3-type subunit 4